MVRKLALAFIVVVLCASIAQATEVKRFESDTGTVVDTQVTNVKDTSISTPVSITSEIEDRIWDMFVVGVKVDTIIALDQANDSAKANDSVGAWVGLYATKNYWNLLLDSQTTTGLPDSITLKYGNSDKQYEGQVWDSLRINVIFTDSAWTTNDSGTWNWHYEIKKIEIKDFEEDKNN